MEDEIVKGERLLCKFKSETGEEAGDMMDLPLECTVEQLNLICNALLQNEEKAPFLFFINEKEITKNLKDSIDSQKIGSENVVEIVYQQQAVFKVLCQLFKDGDVRIWDSSLGTTVRVLAGHTKGVTVVKWGGSNLIYSASQDRTVKVWRAGDGVLCRTLEGHAHWVNTLALNTDYLNRIGPFDPLKCSESLGDKTQRKEFALNRYNEVVKTSSERLVSGSDDFTLFLWDPEKDKKPLARLTGHQQLVNDVKFSPDGRILASASFDKSIKLWLAKTGKFICTLRGHVQAVYMIAFSVDSRLIVSGSADSTLKLWNVQKQKLEFDLPGHADEVYAVDWSTDGSRVASGGKDKVLRLWQN